MALHVEKTIKTPKSVKTEEDTHFEMAVSWLIDYIYLKCHGTDDLIDQWIAWLLDWLIKCLVDWLIDWLLCSTRARGDTDFALVI